MKKILFSAIALVAFTATSMAEEKKVEGKLVTGDACCKISDATYNSVIANGGTSIQADRAAYQAYNECVRLIKSID